MEIGWNVQEFRERWQQTRKAPVSWRRPTNNIKYFAIIQYDGKNIQEPSHAAIVDSFQLSCIHKILSCRIPFSFPSRSIMSY